MTRTLTPHPFASDNIADPLRHVETCVCGLPRRHPRHTMPVVSREVVEVGARRAGERWEG